MQNPENTTAKGTSDGVSRPGRLFSRDVNYLRDVALFWPFVISSIVAASAVFSQSDRQLALSYRFVETPNRLRRESAPLTPKGPAPTPRFASRSPRHPSG